MTSVSVVIPVHNGAATLPACLAALRAQTALNLLREVIVADNGSTDATARVAADMGARVVSCPSPRTSYAARNAALKIATGDVLAFTDDDCVPAPDWIERGVQALLSAPDIGAVAGALTIPPATTWLQRALEIRRSQAADITFNHPFLPFGQTANLFVRREVFARIGQFEDSWISGGDIDFCWRLQRETSFRLVLALEARISHLPKKSLWSVLKQRARWGFGVGLIDRKYARELASLSLPHRAFGVRKIAPKIERVPLDALLYLSWMTGRMAAIVAGRP